MSKPKTKAAERAAEQYEKNRRENHPQSAILMDNIRRICKEQRWRDNELIAKTSISPDTFRRRKNEPFKFLSWEIEDIANVLGVSVSELYQEEKDRQTLERQHEKEIEKAKNEAYNDGYRQARLDMFNAICVNFELNSVSLQTPDDTKRKI